MANTDLLHLDMGGSNPTILKSLSIVLQFHQNPFPNSPRNTHCPIDCLTEQQHLFNSTNKCNSQKAAQRPTKCASRKNNLLLEMHHLPMFDNFQFSKFTKTYRLTEDSRIPIDLTKKFMRVTAAAQSSYITVPLVFLS